jgi:hypothetical protein
LLEQIADCRLRDIEPGVEVDSETLKELHDVRVPEVNRTIKECREATGKYAARRGCDRRLVECAQIQCERAYEWAREVTKRYRREQHHLGSNVPARDVTFVQFDPAGDVSIYEFFMRYEEWSRGFISSDSKAYLLFNKYLPKSLTEGYEELRAKKGNYDAMKAWLIDQYGMLKVFATISCV